jgi:hypothetical protein
MYTERAKFEFHDTVLQSERLRVLANLAAQLEQSGTQSNISPGFSVVYKDGSTTIDVWQPGKAKVLWKQLPLNESAKVLKVTSPESFSVSDSQETRA